MAKLPKSFSPRTVGADYPVGYGKPPKASQFQQGRSGNPSGGSKKVRARKVDASGSPLDRALLKEAGRKIVINENGVRSQITTHEAIVRKLTISAAKGDRAALRQYLDQVLAARERQHREEVNRFSLLVQYVTEQSVARASLAQPGSAQSWPNPSDVVLDYANLRGEVRGPIDEGQAEPFLALSAEYRIWQARLEHLQTLAGQANGDLLALHLTTVKSIEALLDAIQRHLPPSFQAELEFGDEVLSDPLELADPGGGTINLGLLSIGDDDLAYALHVLSAWAANALGDVPRRSKLNIAANTTSLINRLQIERHHRDGGVPLPQTVPDFGQFYDDHVADGLGNLGAAEP